MKKSLRILVLAGLFAGALPVVTPTLAADAAAAPAARYSVATTLVGKMLDDPAANALLKQMIPTVYANEMFQSMGRDLTLAHVGDAHSHPLAGQGALNKHRKITNKNAHFRALAEALDLGCVHTTHRGTRPLTGRRATPTIQLTKRHPPPPSGLPPPPPAPHGRRRTDPHAHTQSRPEAPR